MSESLSDRHVLSNGPDQKVLEHPMRVLALVPSKDIIWLIELSRKHPAKENRLRSYYRAPQPYLLGQMLAHIKCGRVVTSTYGVRRELNMKDADILSSAPSDKLRKRFQRMFDNRDIRYSAVLPILSGKDDCNSTPRTFLQVISDPDLPKVMKERSMALGMALSTLYRFMHQFWSQGSRKNGLCDGYWRCGNPGTPKPQLNKLGRPSKLFLAREAGPGYIMSDADKRKMGFGYRLINKERTASDAYILTSGVFWADRITTEDGEEVVVLWTQDKRPTQEQFMYWGQAENENKSVLRMILGPRKWNQRAISRGGSIQDQMSAVGQLSFFDGTSTDVYLTSVSSRVRALPAATRMILQEGKSSIIYGLYCGWESPSPATAMQTILHGATSKVEFCRRFGIEIQEDDWPSLLAATHQADHGELKAAVITEAEEQFGYSVEYVEAGRGDKKGGVESGHRQAHKALDHKIPGTTHGSGKKRGEEDPAAFALWNYWEYMHELILAVLDYNNTEVLELAPVAMLQQEPQLRPTRLNIFRWLRKSGLTSELPRDIEAMRAFMLPTCDAVIKKNGLHLMASIHGHKQILPKLRYNSLHPDFLALLSQVKLNDQVQKTRVRLDPQDLSVAWLTTRQGMIRLTLASSDTLLRQRITLNDWCRWLEDLALRKDAAKGERQQNHLKRLLRQEAITATAKSEQRQEVAGLPKPPNKKQKRKDMTANREVERILLQQAAPAPSAPIKNSAPAAPVALVSTAADRAMKRFSKQPNQPSRG